MFSIISVTRQSSVSLFRFLLFFVKDTAEPNRSQLTIVIVFVVLAVHLEWNGAVRASPSFDADALVLALLQRTLTVARASVLTASYKRDKNGVES